VRNLSNHAFLIMQGTADQKLLHCQHAVATSLRGATKIFKLHIHYNDDDDDDDDDDDEQHTRKPRS